MKTSLLLLIKLHFCLILFYSCQEEAAKTSSSTSSTAPSKAVSSKNDDYGLKNISNLPLENGNIPCKDSKNNLDKIVNQAATELSGTPYSEENKTDCSGMFHKMLDKIRIDCPRAKFPSIANARDSRSLAAWYHDNGSFKIIRDPAVNSELIQVGAVMFYGYQDKRDVYDFQNIDMKTLTTRGEGINHVSIVTSVNRVNGVLESYSMFHGRRPGVAASVTDSHRVTSWDETWPMYGNAMEPWLAVASIFGDE